MDKRKLFELLDDLLQDCYNDVYEYAEIDDLSDKEQDLVYNNVKLFVIKLKERIEDEEI